MAKGMGRGKYLGDAVNNFSGWLKILEIILLFITILLHRYGDNGRYLFFATAMEQIQYVRFYKYFRVNLILTRNYNSLVSNNSMLISELIRQSRYKYGKYGKWICHVISDHLASAFGLLCP